MPLGLLCAGAFFPRTSPFAWARRTSLSIVLFFSTTARGRAPLLFWVYECVREVLCVCDRPIHFCPRPSSPTVFKRKPLLSCHAGAPVCVRVSVSFIYHRKTNPPTFCGDFAGFFFFFCQAKCVWPGTSTVCQAGYPAVLFNINPLLIVTLDMLASLSTKPEWRENT